MLYPNKRFIRAKVPLNVLVGWTPTQPLKLQGIAKPKDGEAILSGMAIAKDGNGEWVKTVAGDTTSRTKSIFIAIQDQDDHAVQASGKLTALDCSDEYEVQTGYVNASGTYAVDAELAVMAGGIFKLAASGDKVVGKVTKVGNAANALIDLGLTALAPSATDMKVIQFKTCAPYLMP